MTAEPSPQPFSAIVVAAGQGLRAGQPVPKQFALWRGKPVLRHAVERLQAAGAERIVIAIPENAEELAAATLHGLAGIRLVTGGATRADSVRLGVAEVPADAAVVLVHDAARCLTPVEVFERVIAAVADGAKGAIPGVPVVDTIKVVDDAGQILATPAREGLRAVQTPQGFDRAVLEQAHAAGAAATDDAALVEALGHAVLVVSGDPRALKITTPADLAHAERLLTTASP